METLKRPKATYGTTERMVTGCGNLYITVNFVEDTMFEVFALLGKTGGCAAAQSEAICRIISIALRSGVDPASIIKQLNGIRCPSQTPKYAIGPESTEQIFSCADAISKAMANAIKNNHGNTNNIDSADNVDNTNNKKKGGELDG